MGCYFKISLLNDEYSLKHRSTVFPTEHIPCVAATAPHVTLAGKERT